MLSDKLFESKINKEIFKIDKNVILSKEISKLKKRMYSWTTNIYRSNTGRSQYNYIFFRVFKKLF